MIHESKEVKDEFELPFPLQSNDKSKSNTYFCLTCDKIKCSLDISTKMTFRR